MREISFKFILLLFLVAALLFMVFRPFAYAIVIAAVITAVVVILFFTVKGFFNLTRKFRIRNTLEGIIEEKIEALDERIAKLTADITTITTELGDIDLQLEKGRHSKHTEDKLLRLKDEFLVEQELILEKRLFFRETKAKFNELLLDQKALKKISSKQDKLKKVRNDQQEDRKLENDLSSEKETIEELDYLTLRMENTVHIDEVRDIQLELNERYRF